MLIFGSYDDFVIVRTSMKGNITFFTGSSSQTISEAWSSDRAKAKVLRAPMQTLQNLARGVVRSTHDRVMIIPNALIDDLSRWIREDGARKRRAHRSARYSEHPSTQRTLQ